MEVKQPTQEQIREFWEWCGFIALTQPDDYGIQAWKYPNQSRAELSLPSIDLNNLFKLAVPKVIKKFMTELECNEKAAHILLHKMWLRRGCDDLTLFWAIWEQIHGN